MKTRATLRAKVNMTGQGEIFLDDKDISHLITGFAIKSDVRELTTVVLRLIGVDLDLEIEGELPTTESEAQA